MNMQKILTETGHRIITPDHHPKNIRVVEAANMTEAIKLADVGLRQDGIQGVVWYRTPNPNANEMAFKLYKAFQERVGLPPDPNTFFSTNSAAARLVDHERLVWTYDAPWYSEYNTSTFSLQDVFTNRTRDEILDCAAAFNSLDASLFFLIENSNNINIHIDGAIDVPDSQKCRDNLLFRGFDTAAVMALSVAGTLIAETDVDGAPFLKPGKPNRHTINHGLVADLWSLELNSWLFFHPEWTEFGFAKSLIHSFPGFDISPQKINSANPPRIFFRADF